MNKPENTERTERCLDRRRALALATTALALPARAAFATDGDEEDIAIIEDAASEADETESELDAAEDATEEGVVDLEPANSWRYEDGEPIEHPVTDSGMQLLTTKYPIWKKSYGTSSYGLYDSSSSTTTTVTVEGVEAVGIDVSSWQGSSISWSKVAADGISFAIIRCGYGSDIESQDDSCWAINVAGAQAAGLDIGVYLYSYATNTGTSEGGAACEAAHVLRLLDEVGLEPADLALPVFLDMEDDTQYSLSASKLGDIAETFCNAIEAAGYTPGVYASKSWWKSYFTDSVFEEYGWYKWVALYSTAGATASGIDDTGIWQFSCNGTVSGISGNVDMNFLYSYPEPAVDLDELAAENKGTITPGTYVIASKLSSRMVLDVKSGSTSNSANIQLYTSNGTAAQKWVISEDDDGYLTLTSSKSGRVLDVKGGKSVSGTNVQQYGSNSTAAQKWVAVADDSGYLTFYSGVGNGMVLDVADSGTSNGTNIDIRTSRGISAQKFKLHSCDVSVAACEDLGLDGFYTVATAVNTNYVLDIASGSLSDSANAQIYKSNGTMAQTFRLVYADGYYSLVNATSGAAVRMTEGDVVPGTNVSQLSVSSISSPQQYAITENDDGTYTFTNRSTGLVLDVKGGSAANGTNVQGWGSNSTTAQTWVLTAKDPVITSGKTYEIYSATATAYVLDVKGGKTTNGINVQLYKKNSTNAQRWKATKNSDGTYTFKCVKSGKALDVKSGKAVSGQNVQQYTSNSTNAQKWVVEWDDSRGGFVLTSAINSGYCLATASTTAKNSVNIQLAAKSSTSLAQVFTFKTIS